MSSPEHGNNPNSLYQRVGDWFGQTSLGRQTAWIRAGFYSRDAQDFYAQVASHYDTLFGADYYMAEEITDRFLPGGAKAVDLGCGTGLTTIPLAWKYDHVIGVDITEPMLNVARANLADIDTDYPLKGKIDLVRGDFTQLPIESGSVDAATCIGAIWHLPKDKDSSFAAEVYRILKPAGKVFISAQADIGLGKLEEFLWNRTGQNKKVRIGAFTPGYISKILRQAGFETKYHICWSLINPWIAVEGKKPLELATTS